MKNIFFMRVFYFYNFFDFLLQYCSTDRTI